MNQLGALRTSMDVVASGGGFNMRYYRTTNFSEHKNNTWMNCFERDIDDTQRK